jgi:hypothetical protein
VLRGDWPAVKAFLVEDPRCVRGPISKDQGTALAALHNAVLEEENHCYKRIVEIDESGGLEIDYHKRSYGPSLCSSNKNGDNC